MIRLRDAPRLRHVRQFLPIFALAGTYTRERLVSDLIAGVMVAIMLVPQSMAYAGLAGLPPEVGLYASIVPLIVYGLLGTSRSLAVGPVAIVSLLVASGISGLAEVGSAEYVQLALTLALLVGVIQFAMGVLRLGFLVNFLSHPVLSGFTSAAAIVIGFSQLKHVLGFAVPRSEHFYEQVLYTLQHLSQTNGYTLAIGLLSIGVLLYFKHKMAKLLRMWHFGEGWVIPISKSGPLITVLLGTLLVWGGSLDEQVAVVGVVPLGLPSLTMPLFDIGVWQVLQPTALAISFVGYMESISVAKSLASPSTRSGTKRREKIEPNQELVALGMANLGGMLTGGYPITGGFSRSLVNFAAGATSGMASIITALLVALTLLWLTPLFYFLPQAVLAAIILVAITGLLDTHTLRHVWQYNKADAWSLIMTFGAVLAVGVERGILIGAATSIALYLWRTSIPHVAIVGQLQGELYRNILRHDVQTWPHLVAVRVDESLYFANSKFLEEMLLRIVAEHPDIEHIVLVCSAINFIDASAKETLEQLIPQLREAGVQLHLAAIKGPVMDRLKAIGFVDQIGQEHIHLSTHDAMKALGGV